MKGMALSQRFYREWGEPMIEQLFSGEREHLAAGLVGEGSICFGYDDEISRDHDWGPAFCLWLDRDTYSRIGKDLSRAYRDLPGQFEGHSVLRMDAPPLQRVGVFEISGFYQRFTGLDHPPRSHSEWRRIPETYLSVATNGRVFDDPAGDFTRYRDHLLNYYPEDIRRKKIAARCMSVGQAGQYNYERSLRRGETVAAQLARSRFLEATASLVYLLNRKYTPFYKWLHKGLRELPLGGGEIAGLLERLCGSPDRKDIPVIEEICSILLGEMRSQFLTDAPGDFLFTHGPAVQQGIVDPAIRCLPVTED